jgi:hypothetical protein
MAELDMSDLRERIDNALFYVNAWDAGEVWYIVVDILDAIFGALKHEPNFADLSHDRFDALTANVREHAYQELGEQIDWLCDLADVECAIDREFQSESGE